MTQRLFILGAGGLARELENMFRHDPPPGCSVTGFLFADEDKGHTCPLDGYQSGLKIVGDWRTFDFRSGDLCVIGTSQCEYKKRMFEYLKGRVDFLTYVHSSCVVYDYSSLGDGVVVCPGCVISTNVHLQQGVLINTGSLLGHDISVGAFSSLMVNVAVGGRSRIGSRVFVGSGATLIPDMKVCDDAVIGAGATVIGNIRQKGTWFGNPARRYS